MDKSYSRRKLGRRDVTIYGKIPATIMKEFVNSQKFESTADEMAAMKDMFAEILQQMMECGLEENRATKKREDVG